MTPRKKPKVTSGIGVSVSDDTLMLMETLKSYFDCDESALFELMIRKLHDETFYTGHSPLVKSIIAKADKANDESAETEKPKNF